MKYAGGCHCGRVRFEVESHDAPEVEDCNCSICAKSGYLHLIVPKSQFRLLKGEEELSEYRFNSGVARHFFCKHCGIKPFYIPRSNPDGVDVNLRCLDEAPANAKIVPFDGQNWEANAASLAHKSQE
ncbi:GFA family protein [Paraferrimonas sedimenticola]|uniref:Aldehyde-activating protein n=1 Tax=Paraferrimonas sedimenticola TaxID=375674 RepID=A0AA37VX71_9GAMM|nr:GFA family protein [Paraferrimonas sedimenticola]GLP96459.1 aldehyde-activating protein [Paraferrimonas sedimenticola]